tara:strand:+ start:116 stop:514 length:399 start_codon:yes stop_codon:yes gene_type:complete
MDLKILKIASDTVNHKILSNYSHKTKLKSSLCGDEMQISLKIKNNKIIKFGYECKSCIYCQASASVLSRISKNKSLESIIELINLVHNFSDNSELEFPKKWEEFKILFNKKNLSRKECILLPFKTLSNALKS